MPILRGGGGTKRPRKRLLLLLSGRCRRCCSRLPLLRCEHSGREDDASSSRGGENFVVGEHSVRLFWRRDNAVVNHHSIRHGARDRDSGVHRRVTKGTTKAAVCWRERETVASRAARHRQRRRCRSATTVRSRNRSSSITPIAIAIAVKKRWEEVCGVHYVSHGVLAAADDGGGVDGERWERDAAAGLNRGGLAESVVAF